LIITRPDAHRSTTSAGHASPPTSSAAASSASAGNVAAAEGVWVITLTRCETSNSWKSLGEPATHSGTTTSRPPRNSAPQISHAEKSKA
jgi:hypothetical protein